MPERPQGYLNREVLIAAAAQLRQQIKTVEDYGRFPLAAPKLWEALAEIENFIAELEPDVA